MTKLILFALTLTAPLGHALATFEARGTQLCAAERCFDRVPLGPDGIDLVEQLTQYEAKFDADFTPKGGGRITFASVLAVAGALGLSDESRARVLKEFSRLKLTDLAADAATPVTSNEHVEIPFVAKVAWADRGPGHGETAIKGRLVLPRDHEVDVNQPSGDLNKQLAAMIRIDETSAPTPTTAQITELLAPAVLGNLVLAYLAPLEQLEGTALEKLGRFLTGTPATK